MIGAPGKCKGLEEWKKTDILVNYRIWLGRLLARSEPKDNDDTDWLQSRWYPSSTPHESPDLTGSNVSNYPDFIRAQSDIDILCGTSHILNLNFVDSTTVFIDVYISTNIIKMSLLQTRDNRVVIAIKASNSVKTDVIRRWNEL